MRLDARQLAEKLAVGGAVPVGAPGPDAIHVLAREGVDAERLRAGHGWAGAPLTCSHVDATLRVALPGTAEEVVLVPAAVGEPREGRLWLLGVNGTRGAGRAGRLRHARALGAELGLEGDAVLGRGVAV